MGTCRLRRLAATIPVAVALAASVALAAERPDRIDERGSVSALEVAVRGGSPPEPTTPTVPEPAAPGRSLLVSDSAWLGLRIYGGVDSVQGFEHTLSLASCRRRVATSCTNYDGYVPPTLLAELDAHPDGYGTLIVATGYNDSDGAFLDEIDTIVRRARSYGYTRIVWLTLRANVSYTSPGDAGFAEVFERSNETLQSLVAAGTYPEIVVADWAAYARDRPEWFASDGIHLRAAGPVAAGDYISRKIAFLDGAPCPRPERPGTVRLTPCPDPDRRGPVVDLPGLYPVGDLPVCFQLHYEGSSTWPDPPRWEC